MAKKIALEDQMKELEKQFWGIVKLVKILKSNLESLEKKISNQENDEIREIIETQKVIDEVIVANSDAIRRMDKEIKDITDHRLEASTKINLETSKSNEKGHEEPIQDQKEKNQVKRKRCKHFNKGHCKYSNRCRNSHPTEVCGTYLGSGKCDQRSCQDRHPKICKWWLGNSGCRRNDMIIVLMVFPH